MRYQEYEQLCQSGLPEAFWDRFAEDYWDREPGVFARAEAAPLATSSDAATCLLRLLAAPDKHSQLFLSPGEGGRLAASRFAELDLAEGGRCASAGLDAVIAWLCRTLGWNTVFAYINRVHNVSADLWLRSRDFLYPLATRVGLPSSSLDLDFFFGNYPVTPTHIHRDAGNLTFVLQGRKRFLVWPFDTFRDHPEVARDPLMARETTSFIFDDPPALEDYRDRAIVLDATVGDIVYWPGGFWHIAEAVDSAATATFTMSYLESGVQVIDDSVELVERTAKRNIGAYVNRAAARVDGSDLMATLDAQYAVILALLDDVREELRAGPSRVAGAVRLTSLWTSDPPALHREPGEIDADTELIADARFPILVCDGDDVGAPASALALVCCGRAIVAPRLDGLTERFVACLNRGEPVSVRAFAAAHGDGDGNAAGVTRRLVPIAARMVSACGAFVVE